MKYIMLAIFLFIVKITQAQSDTSITQSTINPLRYSLEIAIQNKVNLLKQREQLVNVSNEAKTQALQAQQTIIFIDGRLMELNNQIESLTTATGTTKALSSHKRK